MWASWSTLWSLAQYEGCFWTSPLKPKGKQAVGEKNIPSFLPQGLAVTLLLELESPFGWPDKSYKRAVSFPTGFSFLADQHVWPSLLHSQQEMGVVVEKAPDWGSRSYGVSTTHVILAPLRKEMLESLPLRCPPAIYALKQFKSALVLHLIECSPCINLTSMLVGGFIELFHFAEAGWPRCPVQKAMFRK